MHLLDSRPQIILVFLVCLIGVAPFARPVAAQTVVADSPVTDSLARVARRVASPSNSVAAAATAPRPSPMPSPSPTPSSEMDEVRRQLTAQQSELERLREMVVAQSKLIAEMQGRAADASAKVASTAAAAAASIASSTQEANTAPQNSATQSNADERLGKIEAEVKRTNEAITRRFGSLSISGDIRLRFEPTFGQLNSTPNDTNPAVLGNPLTVRNRARLRARLSIRGQVNEEFEWGLRLATGSFADVISTNQSLTDFFDRKPFALDQAFISYKPKRIPGLRLQGGKFEIPWTFTEMTLDQDLQVEGINESYSRDFKNKTFKNLTFVAWQLPFLERNSAFVRNANGTVNLDESNRQGRDLALYGAQLRTRLLFSPKTALTLSAADLYYSGTQFITPVQVFGANLQLPVSVTIPATATAPAQTLTSVVSIPRDFLVAGNANLGISTATNNSTNRDGRLSSGFNLVDLIGRLDLTQSERFPVALLFNFVTNTQARDVVTAGAAGANLLLSNNENNGYWAEIQIGKTRERGDMLFGYTFLRIEKDAVLTPFNFSDIAQQSDIRAQRFNVGYGVNSRVVLALTGIFTERPNGLRGVFGATPAGSLNRRTTRLQFDTILRF